MPTPKYPRNVNDDLRELRASRSAAQTAGQSRAAFTQASQGLILPDLGAHPASPPAGSVILYGLAGHLWCKEADGSQHQLTT